MPRLAQIRIHPLKGFAGVAVERATVTAAGVLEGDRCCALLDARGAWVNGKNRDDLHRIPLAWEDGGTIAVLEGARYILAEPGDRDALAARIGTRLGENLVCRYDAGRGFPDNHGDCGPTLVAAGSLARVADWFPESGAEDPAPRFRVNLVIADAEPFWEDRLVQSDAEVMVRIGAAHFRGLSHCPRCVVPQRHPGTGAAIPGFARRFAQRRLAEMPPWCDAATMPHGYHFTVTISAVDAPAAIAVGDDVRIEGP